MARIPMPRTDRPVIPDWVRIGEIIRPHGRHGVLWVLLDERSRLHAGWTHFYVRDPSGNMQIYHVRRAQPYKTGALVEVEEIGSLEEALQLQGQVMYVERTARVPLDADEFYNEDLIGCRVIEPTLGEIGTVVDVYDLGYVQVLAVRSRTRQPVLIPFQKVFVQTVDIAQRVIHVVLPSGWLDLFA